jgi:hypothetical protein
MAFSDGFIEIFGDIALLGLQISLQPILMMILMIGL